MSQITPDDILDDEENRQLAKVVAVKKHIYSHIKSPELIQFLLYIIDNTGFVSFERQSDRRFINLRNLHLSLQIDLKKAVKAFPEAKLVEGPDCSREEVIDGRSQILRDTVVTPFMNLMNTMLHAILWNEVPDDFAHTEWMMRILPENFEALAESINNFEDVKNSKERLQKGWQFLFSMASAFIFPPEGDLNEDTGFAMEMLL